MSEAVEDRRRTMPADPRIIRSRPLGSPDERDAVLPKHAVGGNDRELVLESLCREQTIEWIAVAKRQVNDSDNMPELDVEQGKAVERQLLRNEPVKAPGETKLSKTELDRELPAAGDAEEDLVVGIGYSGPRSPTDRRCSLDPPEEHVRIEQQFHRV